MKKLAFALFVLLTTTVVFNSCKEDEEMTDAELYTVILNNGEYSDNDETDLDEVKFVGTVATYYYDNDPLTAGSWNVVNEVVVITDASDGSITNLTISDEGDKLTAPDGTVLVKK